MRCRRRSARPGRGWSASVSSGANGCPCDDADRRRAVRRVRGRAPSAGSSWTMEVTSSKKREVVGVDAVERRPRRSSTNTGRRRIIGLGERVDARGQAGVNAVERADDEPVRVGRRLERRSSRRARRRRGRAAGTGTCRPGPVPPSDDPAADRSKAPQRMRLRGLTGGRRAVTPPSDRSSRQVPSASSPAAAASCPAGWTLDLVRSRLPSREGVRDLYGAGVGSHKAFQRRFSGNFSAHRVTHRQRVFVHRET